MSAQIRSGKDDFHKTLIIDIETVPLKATWDEVPPSLQKHWEHKAKFIHFDDKESMLPADSFEQRAGVFAEFGKVICIGLGFITIKEGKKILRLKSLQGNDEKVLLQSFCDLVNTFERQNRDVIFCGHNIKEFDLPFLCRRMLVNGLELPACLRMGGLRPWQVPHIDTLELWRFGDYKHYTSLDLLATILGVDSSKSNMDGSMVGTAYWKDDNLSAIAEYCLRDISTTAHVYLRLLGTPQELEEEYV